MADLETRVAVLETEFNNMEEALKRLDVSQKEHQDITLQIKERLDKQNGLIPHMAESLKAVATVQNQMMTKMNEEAVRGAGTKVKLGIMWAVLSAIGMGVLGYVLKGFLG